MNTYSIIRTDAATQTVIASGLDEVAAADRLIDAAGASYDIIDGDQAGADQEVLVTTATGREIWFDAALDDVSATICRMRLRNGAAVYSAIAHV
ncbi:hypothetical protein P7L78_21865 [Tistrella bauzanensis]|uniref:hypothetical protein n=1 Tax=Tistrella TaxID=171436 RepID=UPI0031F60B14